MRIILSPCVFRDSKLCLYNREYLWRGNRTHFKTHQRFGSYWSSSLNTLIMMSSKSSSKSSQSFKGGVTVHRQKSRTSHRYQEAVTHSHPTTLDQQQQSLYPDLPQSDSQWRV